MKTTKINLKFMLLPYLCSISITAFAAPVPLLEDTDFENGFRYGGSNGCSAANQAYCAMQQVVTTPGTTPSWDIAVWGTLGSMTDSLGVPNPQPYLCQPSGPHTCQFTSYVKNYAADPSGLTLLQSSQDLDSGIPLDANGNIPVVIEGSDAAVYGIDICDATTAIPNNYYIDWWFPMGRCDRARPRLDNFPSLPGSPNYGPLMLRQVSAGGGAVTLTTNSFNEYFFRHANPLPSSLMTGYRGRYTVDIEASLDPSRTDPPYPILTHAPTSVFPGNALPSYLYIDQGVDDSAVYAWSDPDGGGNGWQHMYMVQSTGMAPIGAMSNFMLNMDVASEQYNYVPCDGNAVNTTLPADSHTYGGGCKANSTMGAGTTWSMLVYRFQDQAYNYPASGFNIASVVYTESGSAPAWSCVYGTYMDAQQYAAYQNNQLIPEPNGVFDINSIVLLNSGTYPATEGTQDGYSLHFPSKGSAYPSGLTFSFAPDSGGLTTVRELSQVVTNMPAVVASQSTGNFVAPQRAVTEFTVDGSHVVKLARFWGCPNPDGSSTVFYVPPYKLIKQLDASNGGPIPNINDPYATCATTGLNYNNDGSVNHADCTKDQPSSGGYNGPPLGLMNGKYAYYDVENGAYANWQATNLYATGPYNGIAFPLENIFSPFTLNPNPALGSRDDTTLVPVTGASYSYGVQPYKSYVGSDAAHNSNVIPYPNTGAHIPDPNYRAPWEDMGGRTWNTGGNLGKITYQKITSPITFSGDLMPYLAASALATYDSAVYAWLTKEACTDFVGQHTQTELSDFGLLQRHSHPIPTNVGIPNECFPPIAVPTNIGDGYVTNAFVLQGMETTDLSVNSMTYSDFSMNVDIANTGYAQSLVAPLVGGVGGYSIPVSWYVLYALNPFLEKYSAVSIAANGFTYGYNYDHGLNPTLMDNDGDGMPDQWEVQYGLNPLLDDAAADMDGDSLLNSSEYSWQTYPDDTDTDDDGLSDFLEVGSTFSGAYSAINPDTDGDTVNDGNEDYDSDGMPNLWELQYNLNPVSSADGVTDADGDNLGNQAEYVWSTNPRNPDTDYDGLTDWREIVAWNAAGFVAITTGPQNHLDPAMVFAEQNYIAAIDDTGYPGSSGANFDLWSVLDGSVILWNEVLDNKSIAGLVATTIGGSTTDCILYSTGTDCYASAMYNGSKLVGNLDHACALDSGDATHPGAVSCFGDGDAYGQVTGQPSLTTPKDVAVGLYHSCALDASGVKCWGKDTGPGYINAVPTFTSTPIAIAAGDAHTCAIISASPYVKCWGDNSQNQLSPLPSGLSSPWQIVAGSNHTCVINGDYTVKCWGANDVYQSQVPGSLSVAAASNTVVRLSASGNETCSSKMTAAHTISSAVRCWPVNVDINNSGSLADSDADGLSDYDEITATTGGTHITNPQVTDTDGDGTLDDVDASPADTDNDGTDNNTDSDDDGDGMPDIWELQYGFNPLLNSDAVADLDSDLVSNLQEYLGGTNPAVTAGTLDTTFTPGGASNTVSALAAQADGKVLIGGAFTLVNTVARNRIARLNTDGSLDTGFNPSANGAVSAIVLQADGKVLIGGSFTAMSGTTRNRIARSNADGSLDTAFDPNAGGTVSAIAVQADGKVLIGGAFTTVGGTTRNRVARLNADGSLDTTFNPNANGAVSAIAVQTDGKVLIGGSFTTVGGTTRNRIARLNADGSLDTTFNPNANSAVSAIVVQVDGKVLIGGSFTTVGGTTRNRTARLNADGSLDTTFDPNASGAVSALAVQADGKALIGGSFATVGGATHNNIARLNTDGSVDTSFNAGTGTGSVYGLAIQSDKLFVGGTFTTVNSVTRNRIARIYR